MLTMLLEANAKQVLRKHVIFSILDEEKIERLVKRFEVVSFGIGETILREGEPGDCAYLIFSGKVRAYKEPAAGKPITLGVLGAGDLFGEQALLQHAPRSASCRAVEDVVLFKISRQDFEELLRDNSTLLPYFDRFLKQNSILNFLRQATVLGSVPARQVVTLLDQLEECVYQSGDTILQEGEPGDRMFFIKSGEVRVLRGPKGRESMVNHLGEGDYFGERALIAADNRAASVVASKNMECFSLSRENFQKLVASAPQLEQQLVRRIEQYHIGGELEARYGVKGPGPVDRELGRTSSAEEITQSKAVVDPPPDGARRARWWPSFGKRYAWIPQYDETDCGAACLAMVSRSYGVRISVGRLREAAGVGRAGGTMFHLAKAAETVGFACQAIKTDYGHLAGLALPAIAHWKGYHYVVLFEVNAVGVVVGDPAVGLLHMPREEFGRGWTGNVLVLTPTARLQTVPPAKSIWQRVLPLLPCKNLYAAVILISVLLALLRIAFAVLTQIVVDHFLVSREFVVVAVSAGSLFFLGAAHTVCAALRHYVLMHIHHNLRSDLGGGLFRLLLKLPMSFFQSRRPGDILARFEDGRRVQEALTGKIILTVLDLFALAPALVLMSYYSLPLTVVVLLAMPVYLGGTVYFFPLLRRQQRQTAIQESKIKANEAEVIAAIGAIKGASAEASIASRHEKLLVQKAWVDLAGRKLELMVAGLSRATGVLFATLLVGYGARLVAKGELTAGQFLAFLSLAGMIGMLMNAFLKLWPEMDDTLLSVLKLGDVYEAEVEQDPAKRAVALPPLRGFVRFEDVCFRNLGDEQDVLQHIDLDIRPGQTIALVGRAGAGKTTLAMLVSRWYLPTHGRVLVDGFDTRFVDIRSLRKQVGIVGTDNPVLSGTVRQNIAWAEPEAPLEQVMEAAKVAGAHEFIMQLPEAYETVLGPGDASLSKEQNQRLGIARALVKDPPILILDDVMLALDPASKTDMQKTLDAIVRNRTVILIAKRVSAIRNADLIAMMDLGRIVEQGSHGELLDKKGLYYYLASQEVNGDVVI